MLLLFLVTVWRKKIMNQNVFFFSFLSLRSKSCASLEIHIYDFSEISYDSNSRAEITLKKNIMALIEYQ